MTTMGLLLKFALFGLISAYMISEIQAQMWGPDARVEWWGPRRWWWHRYHHRRPWSGVDRSNEQPWGPPERRGGWDNGWQNNNQWQNNQWDRRGDSDNQGQWGQGFQNRDNWNQQNRPIGPEKTTTTTTEAPVPSPPGPPGI